MDGLLISIEGIDGSGKSSHMASLCEAFTSEGRVVTMTREPGGTPLAEKLRSMVLNDAMDPLTESLLVFAARRDHIVNVIIPALQRGEVVLCDRFTDSSFAYQGGGRGFDLAVLATLEQWVQSDTQAPSSQSLLQPHLTLWFDLAPELAAARLAGARIPDRFEAQSVDFFRRVVDGYLSRMEAQPERFARIEANQPREAVFSDVLATLRQRGLLQPCVNSEDSTMTADYQAMGS